jgi:ubiquinone biosynthesis monooxygenase Coq7
MNDAFISAADHALRTLSGGLSAGRPMPEPGSASSHLGQADLSAAEKALAGALMRVNHVGEVCAQALYQGQALAATDRVMQQRFQVAARDETDHLAWTQQRLDELGARASLLNPLWYAGSFAIGWLAGRAGDAISLGFVVETERQVEQHLDEHLERLPAGDQRSRAIVHQMKADEARHANDALQAGATPLPAPVRWGMRVVAKVMTTTAHHI